MGPVGQTIDGKLELLTGQLDNNGDQMILDWEATAHLHG